MAGYNTHTVPLRFYSRCSGPGTDYAGQGRSRSPLLQRRQTAEEWRGTSRPGAEWTVDRCSDIHLSQGHRSGQMGSSGCGQHSSEPENEREVSKVNIGHNSSAGGWGVHSTSCMSYSFIMTYTSLQIIEAI